MRHFLRVLICVFDMIVFGDRIVGSDFSFIPVIPKLLADDGTVRVVSEGVRGGMRPGSGSMVLGHG